MKRLFGLAVALLLGALALNAWSQAPPKPGPKKEVVWVRKGPVVKATGMATETGYSMTLKRTVGKIDYENTISWFDPPRELREGDDVLLTVYCTPGKGDVDYARVHGGFSFPGCTDKAQPKDRSVGSSREFPQRLDLKFKFKPTPGGAQIRLDAAHLRMGAGPEAITFLGDLVKTWDYEPQERDAEPSLGTGAGLWITKVDYELPPGDADPEDLKHAYLEVVAADGSVRLGKVGMKLEEGDRLRCPRYSTTEIALTDSAGNPLIHGRSSYDTEFKIKRLNIGTDTGDFNELVVKVERGTLVSTTSKKLDKFPIVLVIVFPNGDVVVKHTSVLVRHDDKKGETTIAVQEGDVIVTPKNAALKPFSLNACQQVKVSATAIGAVESTGPQVTADGRGCCSHACPDPHAAKLTLQAPELLAPKGQEVLVPVYMIKPTNVANINWTLTYDPKVVQPEPDVLKGNLLDKATFLGNAKEAGVIYGGSFETSGLKATATGTVGVVKFKVLGEPGAFTALHLAVTTVNDPAGTKLPIDLLHGSIHVVGKHDRPPGTGPSTPPGGGPTALDALTALKMSVKLIPVDMNYDVDHDGSVTSRDAVIIAQRRLDQLAKGNQ